MPISIDIDGVISKENFLSKIFSRKVNEKKIRYSFLTHSYPRRAVQKEYISRMKIHNGVVDAFDLLKSNGYSVHLNSARPVYLHEATSKWLEKNNALNCVDEINLRQKKEDIIFSKSKHLKNNNISIHIDDNIEIVKKLSKSENVDRVYLVNKKKNLNFTNEKIIIVTSLIDAVKHITNNN